MAKRKMPVAEKEALRLHRAYARARGFPQDKMVHDGIKFYAVGHNASHTFFVGEKAGRRFILAVCVAWDEKTDEYSCDLSVREVASWDGCYLGHY